MMTIKTESQIAVRMRGPRIALAIVSATLLMGTLMTRRAGAQVFATLHSFNGSDGSNPRAGLVTDSAGNLYGTTTGGGSAGQGTVFKIPAAGGVLTVLHNFGDGTVANDGAHPYAGLILDSSGNYLYGTTAGGGSWMNGTVFRLDTSGKNLSVLHSFSGTDGADPQAGLILDSSGNLYGTTQGGGSWINGTVFTLDTSGNLNVLHSFSGGNDGALPDAGLVLDSSGNLYGTTAGGGSAGYGTVFSLDTSSKNFNVLHSFSGTDGANPFADLVLDSSGNLYGTTFGGGSGSGGTVFKLNTSGSPFAVLYSFSGGDDGGKPHAGLVLDSSGNLYGTTFGGYGTVFEIATTPQQGTQLIINQVNTLEVQGALKQGQANSLDKGLNQAISLMNSGKNSGAIQNLQDFIAETEDLESSGVLASPQAEPLTSQTNVGVASSPAELLISEANAVIAELQ